MLENYHIREVIVDASRVFDDPNTDPHHHFYNLDTSALTDIDARDNRLTGPPRGMTTAGVCPSTVRPGILA